MIPVNLWGTVWVIEFEGSVTRETCFPQMKKELFLWAGGLQRNWETQAFSLIYVCPKISMSFLIISYFSLTQCERFGEIELVQLSSLLSSCLQLLSLDPGLDLSYFCHVTAEN